MSSSKSSFDLNEEEEEEENVSFLHNPMRRSSQSLPKLVLLYFLAALFLISYISLAVYCWAWKPHDSCKMGNESIYDDAPFETRRVKFHRAGFHDSHHLESTPYEGEPDSDNNAAWDRLMTVGIASLSRTENRRLGPGKSAPSQKNPNEYVVELEMFHQLHCLKALRAQLWEFELGTASRDESESLQRRQHFDHCIDYLRQVIMCHGDLTPNTFKWNDELGGYLAHHETVHQCRDFEGIFAWAARRNTAGMTIDGDHMNVELNDTQEKKAF